MLLIIHTMLAGAAVVALGVRPRAGWVTWVVFLAASCDLLLGGAVGGVLKVVAPLLVFLAAALTLALMVQRSGLTERLAQALAALAAGNSLALYGWVCVLCAICTGAISLDGAVVLMVPLVLVISRRFLVPAAPLFIGVVVVANISSMAVPQGNPTNLILIDKLAISSGAFLNHMLFPGLLTASVCAVVVAIAERGSLREGYRAPSLPRGRLGAAERHAALAVAAAGSAAWCAPLFGLDPWWPFCGAVALALLTAPQRPELVVPWRIAGQVGGLLVLIGSLGWRISLGTPGSLGGLLALAIGVGAAAALANNLPVGVSVIAMLSAGTSAYAASIGLAAGSIGTPQGSVATLLACEMGGASAPALSARWLAPLAISAVCSATLLLWLAP